jgi:hypothetical protein
MCILAIKIGIKLLLPCCICSFNQYREATIMFFGGSGASYNRMRSDIDAGSSRLWMMKLEERAKLESVNEEYNNNLGAMCLSIESHLKEFKNVLKKAAKFVMRREEPGFFSKTEYDYAEKFYAEINKEKNLDQLIKALIYVKEEADSSAEKGLIRAIKSYSISNFNCARVKLKELVTKLDKDHYEIFSDMLNQLEKVSSRQKVKQKILSIFSKNKAHHDYSTIVDIVMSYGAR